MKTLLWFSVAASLLSALYSGALRIFRVEPAIMQPAAVTAPAVKAIPQRHATHRAFNATMILARARPYSYTFEGQAILAGRPCPNASIDLHVYFARNEKIRHIKTGADGRYSVTVSLMGSENEPMTWEINAISADLHQAQREGRQIMMDEPSITIDGSLNFIES